MELLFNRKSSISESGSQGTIWSFFSPASFLSFPHAPWKLPRCVFSPVLSPLSPGGLKCPSLQSISSALSWGRKMREDYSREMVSNVIWFPITCFLINFLFSRHLSAVLYFLSQGTSILTQFLRKIYKENDAWHLFIHNANIYVLSSLYSFGASFYKINITKCRVQFFNLIYFMCFSPKLNICDCRQFSEWK